MAHSNLLAALQPALRRRSDWSESTDDRRGRRRRPRGRRHTRTFSYSTD